MRFVVARRGTSDEPLRPTIASVIGWVGGRESNRRARCAVRAIRATASPETKSISEIFTIAGPGEMSPELKE
jgi:hypothetical protein